MSREALTRTLVAGVSVVALVILVFAFFAEVHRIDRLSRQVAELLRRAEASEQLLKVVREEVLTLESNLRQPGHSSVRLQMVESQAAQTAGVAPVMLLGDSIMESWYVGEVCGMPALNAGIGGTGLAFVSAYAPALVRSSRPEIVVIGVGINDAARSPGGSGAEYEARWLASYRELVSELQKSGVVPVILSILPVGRDKPLGARSFSLARVKRFNAGLRGLGEQGDAVFVDAYRAFSDSDGFLRPDFTTDGVHLTTQAYRQFAKQVEQGVSAAARRIGKTARCDTAAAR